MADLNILSEAIINGDMNTAVSVTKTALEEGTEPASILNQGLVSGMEVVGQRFKANEIYIPEVLMAARAMKMAMEILEPKLVETGVQPIGKAVMGTVQGDQHDIGKNLVSMMLKGSGFEVFDLGVDVSPEKFMEEAQKTGAQIIGMSSLLTTTMPAMEKTVQAIKDSGISVKTMVGGAPVTQNYADKIGADGYCADAASAVDLAKSLLN